MVRAAAKNHDRVAVVVDPLDYAGSAGRARRAATARIASDAQAPRREGVRAHGELRRRRRELSRAASTQARGRISASRWRCNFRKRIDLRYGENPHQTGGVLLASPHAQGASIGSAQQLQGKTLSYNNIADGDTAFECVRQFAEPACVIVKHANPCGVAVASDTLAAYDQAYKTDPTSAFGGIIAFNRTLTRDDRARDRRAPVRRADHRAGSRRGRARDLRAQGERARARRPAASRRAALRHEYRSVNGGLLVQTRDEGMVAQGRSEGRHEAPADGGELDDLLFAWQVCKYVKSNAIVYAKERMTIGVGAGQMSRVVSSRIAAMKAKDEGLTSPAR